MNYLLFTDPHFTDNPIEAYRWDIFDHLNDVICEYDIDKIYCLGDVVDRKDRHSAVLVNRLVDEFVELSTSQGIPIKILSGNHEKPLNGPYYWEFLNKAGIEYITKPKAEDMIYFFPFSSNPVEEWKDYAFISRTKAVLMHQTGQGVKVEGDRLIPSNNLPKFNGIPVFSGDVHRPQEVEGIVYVGTPHPVRFGEVWNNRVIVIEDDKFDKPLSIWLPSIKRAILDINSSSDLFKTPYKKGDQLKIRYTLTGNDLAKWHEEEEAIKNWANTNGIFLASIEPKIIGDGVKIQTNSEMLAFELMSPDEVITKFASDEKLSDDVLEVGRTLLRSV